MNIDAHEKAEYCKYILRYDFSAFLQDKYVLITGSTGMLGTALTKWLLTMNGEKGTNIHIIASTRHPESVPTFVEEKDQVKYCLYGNEAKELEGARIDYIIHAASPTNKDFYLNYPVEAIDAMTSSTKNMLMLARSCGSKMIYLSSLEVYGEANESSPISEEYVGALDSKKIRSCYPLGKLLSEFLCRAYFEEYGVGAVIIRLAAIQGMTQPYDEPRVFNEMLRCIIEKRNLILHTDGLSIKCFMFTLDAISAILTALFKGVAGEVYNATNPTTYMTIKDLGNYLFENFSPENTVECLQDQEANKYLKHFSFVQDISKIIKLGWVPIKDILDIYRYDIGRFENG